ncbi:MAG: type I restriction enzyme HsdR N-terminal domain-containing protein [Bacteroidetes bacterium]|nr:type I restriction enzyme HsdR N-terminal domain-containing protein [Bacteroidota bacterium]
MFPLNLPAYDYKIKSEGLKPRIFDPIRKKYVLLTPEEWVRQHFINYLFTKKKYPLSLMKIEGGLKYNNQNKRSDIVVYNNQGKAVVLVECKAPDVKITADAFEQAARYNQQLKVDYIIVTNGIGHYCSSIDYEKGSFDFLEDVPGFDKLIV